MLELNFHIKLVFNFRPVAFKMFNIHHHSVVFNVSVSYDIANVPYDINQVLMAHKNINFGLIMIIHKHTSHN